MRSPALPPETKIVRCGIRRVQSSLRDFSIFVPVSRHSASLRAGLSTIASPALTFWRLGARGWMLDTASEHAALKDAALQSQKSKPYAHEATMGTRPPPVDETTSCDRGCAPFADTQGKKESAARDVFTAGLKSRRAIRDSGNAKPRPSTRDEDRKVRHPARASQTLMFGGPPYAERGVAVRSKRDSSATCPGASRKSKDAGHSVRNDGAARWQVQSSLRDF
jgi:hypothetical protein